MGIYHLSLALPPQIAAGLHVSKIFLVRTSLSLAAFGHNPEDQYIFIFDAFRTMFHQN